MAKVSKRLRERLSIETWMSNTNTHRFSSHCQSIAGKCPAEHMDTIKREIIQEDFDVFDISEELGFVLEEPLVS